KSKPELPRSYRLPAAGILSPIAFLGANYVILFTGWQNVSTLIIALLLGYALIALSYALKLNPKAPSLDWQAAPWIITWIVGIGVITYLGDFGAGGIIGGIGFFKNVLSQGGTDAIGFAGCLIASGLFSLIIYFWAVATCLPPAKVDEYVKDVYPPPVTE
ncbi:MAG: APC family permease, partial [Acidimicrobiales bacterium]